MRIGTSVLLIAAGAIMAFAVEVDQAEGFNINTAGIILMVIGALGFLAVLALDAPRRRRTVVEGPATRTVYHDEPVRRTVYHDEVV
jgi:hypothetical protein